MISWEELMSFGSDETTTPSADKMVMLQLTLQAALLKIADTLDSKWRSRVFAYVKLNGSGASSRRSSAANMTYEVLFGINDGEEVRESRFEKGLYYYTLPKDFKLTFFGTVGN